MTGYDLSAALIAMGDLAFRAIANGCGRETALLMATQMAVEVYKGEQSLLTEIGPSLGLAWAKCGFPTIEPSHRLAASLMATTMPPELISESVRMPWRCFAFRIPTGIIDEHSGLALVLHSHSGLFQMMSTTGTNELHYGYEHSLSDWNLKIIGHSIGDEEINPGHELYATCDLAGRHMELRGRLFVGICAELNNRTMGSNGYGSRRLTKRSQFPRTQTFKLTRPVNLDVRSAIRCYAEGTVKTSPTIQVLVRGHWKHQPVGALRADRKLIHVEPYWRGPETAPIGVRSHLIGVR